MDKAAATLRVFFEEPFWVGVIERVCDGELTVCKVTFGPEPRDYEVLEFFLKNYYRLRFSPAVAADESGRNSLRSERKNPKRRLREAKRELKSCGLGTKSQQALSLEREQLKTERKAAGKERKTAEEERIFQLKQQKRKEKHRGR